MLVNLARVLVNPARVLVNPARVLVNLARVLYLHRRAEAHAHPSNYDEGMDPLLLAEFWWVAPIVVGGGGAVTFASIRLGKRHRAANLEYAAARHEVDAARMRVRTARAQVKSAQAGLLIARSARQSGASGHAALDAAKRKVTGAQKELRAAQTGLRGRRVQVQAARAMLHGRPRGDDLPLPRLMATHDEIIGRWMQYETDPAKAIAFPGMTDVRRPTTGALITAMDRARWLRPASAHAPFTPESFANYRTAVTGLEEAFVIAETAAWRDAGARSPHDRDDETAREGMRIPGTTWTVPIEVRDAWDTWMRGARSAASAAATQAASAARDAMTRSAEAKAAAKADPPAAAPKPDPKAPSYEPPPATPKPDGKDRPTWPIPRR